MATISGKHALVELLKQEGIELLFGNPGTTELPLMDALAVEPKVRYVLGLQESAVIAMADGYAQASGRLTAVSVHMMPGLGNAMGMLYEAYRAGTPLLVLAGQHDQRLSFSEPILWEDLPPIARPLVKWSAEVRRLADLPRAIHRAAKTALAPPTGPVFLSLPADILNAEAEIDLGTPTRVAPRVRGDCEAIEEAAALLACAKHPVVMAGNAVAESNAHAELVRIVELLGAVVYLEGIASTASFPSSHPLFRGPMVRLAPQIRTMLEQHDILLSVGGDLLTLSLPADIEPIPPGLTIIHLDTDPWQLGKNYPTRVAVLGDPKASLADLLVALEERITPAERQAARLRFDKIRAVNAAELKAVAAQAALVRDIVPIRAPALMHAIAEALPKHTITIDETISSGMGLRRLLSSDDPKSYFGDRGATGWGIPAAIGAKLAHPDRPVVALVGDGSAMYTIQALWTAAHCRVPVVFVILNNGGYCILKQRIDMLRGHALLTGNYVGMDLMDPRINFVTLSRSLGVEAERAKTVEEVRRLILRGIASSQPLLIDVEMQSEFKLG